MKSYIKGPAIAAIILEALALFTALIMYFNQASIISKMAKGVPQGQRVFPLEITSIIITLIVYVIFMLAFASYEGNSYRTAGVIMIAVLLLIMVISPYITSLQTTLLARKGEESLVKLSVLKSQISIYTAPLKTIAAALMFIAVGRFGVEDEYREPSQINPAVFGQGYTPMQGYMPVQENAPSNNTASDHTQGQ